VAVDGDDRVYVFNWKPQPAVVVFDREGQFLAAWGEDAFGLWQAFTRRRLARTESPTSKDPVRIVPARKVPNNKPRCPRQ
jgi:hypothetical protein